MAMESKDQNVELIDKAIRRLLEERKSRGASGKSFSQGDDDEDDHLHLSRLLSQLESLKGNLEGIHRALPGEITAATSEGGELEAKDRNGGGGGEELDKEEIVKELNILKRQNTITNWLLSVMIVLASLGGDNAFEKSEEWIE